MADTSGLVSLAGAFISAGAAVTTVVLTRRTAVRDRQAAAAELALRYQEPLLHAAFNLQSRLYNIARPTGHRFLDRFLTQGTPAEAEYARVNTVYLLGQYLCWGEILRRESQFVDPVDRQRDREVTVGMERVREVLADSLTFTDPVLRVFRGEQRAIGEVLLTKTDNPSDRARAAVGLPGVCRLRQGVGRHRHRPVVCHLAGRRGTPWPAGWTSTGTGWSPCSMPCSS
jgi:hypothetical protein